MPAELMARIREMPEPAPPVYDCAVCEDARFVMVTRDPQHPLFGEPVPCVCVRAFRVDDLWRRAEIPARYAEMVIESFREQANVHAYELAKSWDGTRNVVLAGLPGRGKTHLAVAMLRREIERGKPGRFAYVPTILDEIRKRYAEGWEGESAQDYEARMARWPLLVLDDLGAERATPWAVERLTLLLEERQGRDCVTVITTNLMSRAAVEQHFAGVRGEAAIEASRLASRIGPGRFEWIEAIGPDMREFALAGA